MNTSLPSTSRREVVKYAAGLGLMAPFASTRRGTVAQEESADYSGHPLIGVWTVDAEVFTIHADGTASAISVPYGPGSGIWRPTSDESGETTLIFHPKSVFETGDAASFAVAKADLTLTEIDRMSLRGRMSGYGLDGGLKNDLPLTVTWQRMTIESMMWANSEDDMVAATPES